MVYMFWLMPSLQDLGVEQVPDKQVLMQPEFVIVTGGRVWLSAKLATFKCAVPTWHLHVTFRSFTSPTPRTISVLP